MPTKIDYSIPYVRDVDPEVLVEIKPRNKLNAVLLKALDPRKKLKSRLVYKVAFIALAILATTVSLGLALVPIFFIARDYLVYRNKIANKINGMLNNPLYQVAQRELLVNNDAEIFIEDNAPVINRPVINLQEKLSSDCLAQILSYVPKSSKLFYKEAFFSSYNAFSHQTLLNLINFQKKSFRELGFKEKDFKSVIYFIKRNKDFIQYIDFTGLDVRFNTPKTRLILEVIQICPNLSTLKLERVTLNYESLKMIAHKEQLTTLSLRECSVLSLNNDLLPFEQTTVNTLELIKSNNAAILKLFANTTIQTLTLVPAFHSEFSLSQLAQFPQLTNLQIKGRFTKRLNADLAVWAQLKELTSLHIEFSPNNQPNLDFLKNLSNLKCLELQFNQYAPFLLAGMAPQIPIHANPLDLSSLEHLPHLTSLKLIGIQGSILQLQSISVLKKLETLDLENSKFDSEEFSYINKFENLKSLNLKNCKENLYAKLHHLKTLTKLERLDLSGNFLAVTDLDCVENLTLKHLDISSILIDFNYYRQRVPRAIFSFKNMKNLQTLALDVSPYLSLSSLKELSALKHLSIAKSSFNQNDLHDLLQELPLESLLLEIPYGLEDRNFLKEICRKDLKHLKVKSMRKQDCGYLVEHKKLEALSVDIILSDSDIIRMIKLLPNLCIFRSQNSSYQKYSPELNDLIKKRDILFQTDFDVISGLPIIKNLNI